MAPILAASVGITPQQIDDERLRSLKTSLWGLEFRGPQDPAFSTPEEIAMPLDIERLVALLEPWQSWAFEEQVSSINFNARNLSL
jgi:hypothetical protein